LSQKLAKASPACGVFADASTPVQDKSTNRVSEPRHQFRHRLKDDIMDNSGNQNPGKPQAATIRYVDQPECQETFADSINSVFFDGQTMRVEFGITRMDEMKQGQQLSGRRYPACRLVLPVSAAIELINKMQQTANALQQAGLVKPAQPKPAA
jgi:hypothetical protein